MRTKEREESQDADIEDSPLPPLPKEREKNQPAITTFFTKSPRQQAAKETQQAKQGETKGKEKMVDVQRKQQPKKILSRKSTRVTQSSPSRDVPIPTEKDDAPTQADPTTEKEKLQKQLAAERSVKEKVKTREVGGGSSPTTGEGKDQARRQEEEESEETKD